MIFFVPALLISASCPGDVSAEALFDKARCVPKILFYAAQQPSGTMICRKRTRSEQTRAFDRRFGKRFNLLAHAMTTREGLGWANDDVLVTPCFSGMSRAARAQAFATFGSELRLLEIKFGLR